MAIDINSSKVGTTWISLLFYISIILLVVSIISATILFLLSENSKAAIIDLDTEIESKTTKEIQDLEKRILLTKKRIDDFAEIIDQHRVNSRFFAELEKMIHPSFFFSKTDLEIGKGKVSFSGVTNDFKTLGQQIFILEEKDFIKNVNLTKAEIVEGGRIGFDIEILLNSINFKF